MASSSNLKTAYEYNIERGNNDMCTHNFPCMALLYCYYKWHAEI